MSKGILKLLLYAQGDVVKKIKIIPNSIIKLLGISCCSWMAWTSINAHAEKITIDTNILQTFDSINKKDNIKSPIKVGFKKDDTDLQGQDAITTESTIVIQKPLTFDGSNKTIKLANPAEFNKNIFKIELPKMDDTCIFENVGSIDGDVNIVKGIFSVPVGTIKGIVENKGELILVASDGQVVDQKIEGSGIVKIQAEGTVKLTSPIKGGLIFTGKGNKSSSLLVDTTTAPQEYLVVLKEGDWIAFDQDFNGTYAGALSGAGGLAKMGEGALTLTGNNKDRNSLTRIFSGEICIGKSENLGSQGFISFKEGALHITDSLEVKNSLIGNVRLIIDEGKIAEISGLIGNEKTPITSLFIEGEGTVSLTRPNSYQGDTSISNAKLQLESGDNLGKGKLLTLKKATLTATSDAQHLDIKQDIVLSEAATIEANDRTINILGNIYSIDPKQQAHLDKEGQGKLAIHGNLSHAKLTILDGLVHVSAPAGTKEAIFFEGNESPPEIFNKIEELRALKESPMKTLHRVHVNADGALSLDRKLLHVKNLSGSGEVILGSELECLVIDSGKVTGSLFTAVHSKDFEPKIVKTSLKDLKLIGNNSRLMADLLIKEGKVQLHGETEQVHVSVMKDGIFAGNASVKSIINTGTVTCGDTIGTLQIEKDFKQGPSGNIKIKVNAEGQSDLIQVDETASLDGKLYVIAQPGIYKKETQFSILEANKIEGAFTGVENTISERDVFALTQEENRIGLLVTETMYHLPEVNEMSETSKSFMHLMQKEQFKEGTEAFTFIENLFAIDNPKDLEKAYSQMTPVQLGGMTHESNINACNVANSFTNALRRNDRCLSSISTIWVEPIGHYARQKHGSGLGNYKSYMGGFVIGSNHFVHEKIVVGAGVGYTDSYLKWAKDTGVSHVASFYAGLNAGWVEDAFYANASLIASTNAFKNKRHVNFSKIDHTTKSDHYGFGLISRLQTGYHFALTQNICLRPFIDLDFYTLYERSVNEKKSSPIHFHRDALISHELRSKVALEATGDFRCNSICFSPGILLGWIAQTPIGKADYKVSLNDTGKQLAVKKFQKHKINQQIALGANMVAAYEATTISLYYEFDFGKDCSFVHQASASLDWKF